MIFRPLQAEGNRFPNTGFLEQFHPLGPVPFYGWPDSTADLGPYPTYDLLRDPVRGWLLVGNGNGQVWALDRDSAWIRQDSTECIGYNFNAFLMPGPVKFGGNGIWRSNGHLIQYLWESYEWETIQLSREIPIYHNGNCYFSRKDSILFILGSEHSNQGIKNHYTVSDSVYKLDVRTGVWQVEGKASVRLHQYTGPSVMITNTFTTPYGIIFRPAEERKLIAIDFSNGSVTVIGGDAWVKLWELGKTNYSKEKVVVSDSMGLYSMNPMTYEFFDTLTWKEVFSKAEETFPLCESPRSTSPWMPWLMGLTAIPLFGLLLIRLRKGKSTPAQPFAYNRTDENEVASPAPTATTFVLKVMDGNCFLNGRELKGLSIKEQQLILILVERRSRKEPLSTQAFNELLEIDQRTIDNQKKIRSEVVRNINRIFNMSGFKGEAIRRNRQEDDRRAIVYELSQEIEVMIS